MRSIPITFATAVNDRQVLQSNLLASSDLAECEGHELLVQEGFSSAGVAYNDAIDRACNDLIVFIHQDVYLPPGWLTRVQSQIAELGEIDPAWGVAGCWGCTVDGSYFGHIYSPGCNVLGNSFDHPHPVQTLDEIVLIMRKSRGLRFDESLPHFHAYGTDLCLTAASRGMRSYALSAFCVHNSRFLRVLPPEFYESYRYIKTKWNAYLPIQTPCIRISRLSPGIYYRRTRELFRKYRGLLVGESRVHDPALLYEDLKSRQLI